MTHSFGEENRIQTRCLPQDYFVIPNVRHFINNLNNVATNLIQHYLGCKLHFLKEHCTTGINTFVLLSCRLCKYSLTNTDLLLCVYFYVL